MWVRTTRNKILYLTVLVIGAGNIFQLVNVVNRGIILWTFICKKKYNIEIILPMDRRTNCLKIILFQIPNLECICTKRSQYHKLPASTDLTFRAHKIRCRTDLSSRRKEWRNNYNCRTSNVRAYTTGIWQIGRHWGRGLPKPIFLQTSVSVNFIYPRIKYD